MYHNQDHLDYEEMLYFFWLFKLFFIGREFSDKGTIDFGPKDALWHQSFFSFFLSHGNVNTGLCKGLDLVMQGLFNKGYQV